MVLSNVDGAMEDGTRIVPAGGSTRYSFMARPSGTPCIIPTLSRIKTSDAASIQVSNGFFYIEPKANPGRYDQEIFIAMHHWEPYFVSMQDIKKGPPPNNELEVMYRSASFNDKAPGHGAYY